MTQGKQLEELMREFERVGVDPNTISAGLAVSQEDAMRTLRQLPTGAGPAAFLKRLRANGVLEHPAAHDLRDDADRASA